MRTLASNDAAVNLGIFDQLRKTSEALDNLANFKLYLDSGTELSKVEEKAYSIARELKEDLIDPIPLSVGLKSQIKNVLIEQSRLLDDLATRSESLVNNGRIDDLKNEVGRIGSLLAQISFYRIEFLSPSAPEVIHSLAVKLRILQYKSIYADSGVSISEFISGIKECAEELGEFRTKIA